MQGDTNTYTYPHMHYCSLYSMIQTLLSNDDTGVGQRNVVYVSRGPMNWGIKSQDGEHIYYCSNNTGKCYSDVASHPRAWNRLITASLCHS